MRVSVENTSSLGRRIVICIPNDQVAKKFDTQLIAESKKASIKGFRKGHVPRSYMEKNFGKQIRQDVVNELMDASFGEALSEKGLIPVARPMIEDIKDVAGHDVEITASFEVFPEIKLSSFSDITVEKEEAEITDADIDAMITKMCDQMGNWETVDRAAQLKDQVKVDLTRTLKGDETAEPQEHKGITLTLDTDRILSELALGLVGKKAEEEATIELVYPADWNDKNLAGKDAIFQVKVHAVEALTALTQDELIEKMKETAADETALRAEIKKGMLEESASRAKEALKEVVLDKLLAKHDFELPDSLLEQERKSLQKEVDQGAIEADELEDTAKRRVQLGLLLNEVIRSKSLKLDEAKLRAHIEGIARQYGGAQEVINAYYSNEQLMSGVQHSVLLEQAIDAVLDEANVTVKSVSYDALVNDKREAA